MTTDPNLGTRYYSQREEDLEIGKVFAGRAPGTFLDIGAADGKTFSNVRRLYELGWNGVLVEASPLVFHALMDNYPDPSRADLVLAVVTSQAEPAAVAPFHVSPDMVSSISDSHRKLWESVGAFRTIYTPRVPLPWITDFTIKARGNVDLISIDVEGSSGALFSQLPENTLGAEVVVVEFDDARGVVEAEGRRRGFEVLMVTAENIVLRRPPVRPWMALPDAPPIKPAPDPTQEPGLFPGGPNGPSGEAGAA